MKIEHWFDANNIDHLKAYQHLEQQGFWPYDFIPEYVTFDNSWQILIMSKLADAWLNEKIP